jgi:hypothetical protein
MPRKTATDLIEKADSTRRTLVAEDLLVICNACRQSQEGAAHTMVTRKRTPRTTAETGVAACRDDWNVPWRGERRSPISAGRALGSLRSFKARDDERVAVEERHVVPMIDRTGGSQKSGPYKTKERRSAIAALRFVRSL